VNLNEQRWRSRAGALRASVTSTKASDGRNEGATQRCPRNKVAAARAQRGHSDCSTADGEFRARNWPESADAPTTEAELNPRRRSSRSAGSAPTRLKSAPDRSPHRWVSIRVSDHAGPKGEEIPRLPGTRNLLAATRMSPSRSTELRTVSPEQDESAGEKGSGKAVRSRFDLTAPDPFAHFARTSGAPPRTRRTGGRCRSRRGSRPLV